jgi:anti-sigma-K factor RskA
MISEHHEELASLYALGLLEAGERAAFESEIAANAELAALVAELSSTAQAVSLTAPQHPPPAALKGRILAALPAKTAENISFRWSSAIPWGLAAGLAVAALWLAGQNLTLRNANQALGTEKRLAELAYRAAKNDLSERSVLAEAMINNLGNRLRRSEDLARLKVSALASLAGNTKEAQAIAVWDPDLQTGLLTFDKLPVLAKDQDYQIWVVDPAYPNPVNGGVFTVDQDGRASLAFKPDQPVRQAAAFAISLEKKGGVPKAEGPILFLGKL